MEGLRSTGLPRLVYGEQEDRICVGRPIGSGTLSGVTGGGRHFRCDGGRDGRRHFSYDRVRDGRRHDMTSYATLLGRGARRNSCFLMDQHEDMDTIAGWQSLCVASGPAVMTVSIE